MSLFGKDEKPAQPAPEPVPVAEFELHALHSIIKQGGKKKLDTLLAMFRSEAPKRVEEIEHAPTAHEAVVSAKVLKSSAANLGLMGLEDACDQIIAAGESFHVNSPLAAKPRLMLKRGLDYLEKSRHAL
jgi:hypothetical protein